MAYFFCQVSLPFFDANLAVGAWEMTGAFRQAKQHYINDAAFGFVSKILQFKAFWSLTLFVVLLGNVADIADIFHRFAWDSKPGWYPCHHLHGLGYQSRWKVGKSESQRHDFARLAFQKVWRFLKKRKGTTKEEIRMKDESVCSLKLCSFLVRGQSNWTRDESHACCRPQRMCNAQSLSCLLLLALVLSSSGVTRFDAFLQNFLKPELPSVLPCIFYLFLVWRGWTQACRKWLPCGTFSMCRGLRANICIIYEYIQIWEKDKKSKFEEG